LKYRLLIFPSDSIGIVVGLVFLNIPETAAGIQSLKTICYYTMPCLFYLSIVVAVFLLCEELVIFDREREDNLYATVPWVASLILSYLPANVIFPVRPHPLLSTPELTLSRADSLRYHRLLHDRNAARQSRNQRLLLLRQCALTSSFSTFNAC
jgi:hypothetical protein